MILTRLKLKNGVYGILYIGEGREGVTLSHVYRMFDGLMFSYTRCISLAGTGGTVAPIMICKYQHERRNWFHQQSEVQLSWLWCRNVLYTVGLIVFHLKNSTKSGVETVCFFSSGRIVSLCKQQSTVFILL